MYTKFTGKGKNNGKIDSLIDYGAKESTNKKETLYFNHRGRFTSTEVKKMMKCAKGLRKEEDKYFHLVLSPSQTELDLLKTDKNLEEFIFLAMDNYAESFGKNFSKDDFEYAAIIHHDRDYDGVDRRRQKPEDRKKTYKERKVKKEGDQRHSHIFIRRILRDGKTKASPLSNSKKVNENYLIQQGFNRNEFKKKNEKSFDLRFNYDRPYEDTYEYARNLWFIINKEKVELDRQARITAKLALERGVSVEEILNEQYHNKKEITTEKSEVENQNVDVKQPLLSAEQSREKVVDIWNELYDFILNWMEVHDFTNEDNSYEVFEESLKIAFEENPHLDKELYLEWTHDEEFYYTTLRMIEEKIQEKINQQGLGFSRW